MNTKESNLDDYNIIGVFGNEKRHNKISRPLQEVDISFDQKIFHKEAGWKGVKRDLNIFFNLIFSSTRKKLEGKQTIIISDVIGRNLLLTVIASLLPWNNSVIRPKGSSIDEIKERLTYSNRTIKKYELKIDVKSNIIAYKICDLIIPVSKWLSNNIKDKTNIKENKIKVVRTPQLKDIRKKEDYSSNESVELLAVSDSTFQRKINGLDYFLKTQDELTMRKNLSFDIAGPIDKDKLASNFENITFLGFIEDIENLYKDYDIFIHFSYLDTVPSTVLEAYSAGLPVIVNNACAMPEIVEDGKTGFIVDLDDKEEVKEKIMELANDQKKRKELGMEGKKKVENEHNCRVIGNQFKRALEEII